MATGPEFKDIKHKKMVTMVIDQITEAIMDNRLRPGDRIAPEQELVKVFGVGRSTVREALKAIETLGLISRNNGGTFVSVPQSDVLTRLFQCFVALKGISFEDLMQVRLILETKIAALVAEGASDDEIECLGGSLGAAAEAESDDAIGRVYVDFHMQLAKLTHNQAIIEVFNMLRPVLLQSQMITLCDPAIREGGADQGHREIFANIKARDPQRAARAMKEHILQVYRGITP